MSHRRFTLVLATVMIAVTAVGCGDAEQPEEVAATPVVDAPVQPATGPADAGDEAFVKRVVPLLWGRRPASIREVQVLTAMAEQVGREKLVRAMTTSPDYLERWELFFKDQMAVARMGWYSNPNCYGRSAHPEPSTALAEFVRDNAPDGAAYPEPWTIRDLIHSSLLLDNMIPMYRANLFGHLTRALEDQNLAAAFGQRRGRAQVFMGVYLNRRMACMGCHNTSSSPTDHADPEVDRFWPIENPVERALFGADTGIDLMFLTPFFRRKGVLSGYIYTKDLGPEEVCPPDVCDKTAGVYPWGWHEQCGNFLPPAEVAEEDAEDITGFFVKDHGTNGSIWDLEAYLRLGAEKLPAADLVDGQELQGDVAFAWMLSQNIAGMVWKAAFGQRPTVVNFFPRNRAQRDLLRSLTDTFVSNDYSLVELLVAVTGHPYFNGKPPAEGEYAEPYEAVFDPFVQFDRVSEDRRNVLEDTITRMPSRTLLNSAFTALGWAQPPEFLMHFLQPEAEMHRNAGVFLKTGEPGFSGTSFQSAISWEALFGSCADRAVDPVCPLEPIFAMPEGQLRDDTVCELCDETNKAAACDWDARCCDVDWDAHCLDDCSVHDTIEFERERIYLETWPKVEQPTGADWIVALMETAAARDGTTLGDVVSALKDRLIADPNLEDVAERAVLEALAGKALSDPIAGDAEAETRIRRVCGLLLATPQFQLMGWPGPDAQDVQNPLVVPGTSFQTLCEKLGPVLFGATKVQCTEDGLTVAAD